MHPGHTRRADPNKRFHFEDKCILTYCFYGSGPASRRRSRHGPKMFVQSVFFFLFFLNFILTFLNETLNLILLHRTIVSKLSQRVLKVTPNIIIIFSHILLLLQLLLLQVIHWSSSSWRWAVGRTPYKEPHARRKAVVVISWSMYLVQYSSKRVSSLRWTPLLSRCRSLPRSAISIRVASRLSSGTSR